MMRVGELFYIDKPVSIYRNLELSTRSVIKSKTLILIIEKPSVKQAFFIDCHIPELMFKGLTEELQVGYFSANDKWRRAIKFKKNDHNK